jgi:hypothetical protein
MEVGSEASGPEPGTLSGPISFLLLCALRDSYRECLVLARKVYQYVPCPRILGLRRQRNYVSNFFRDFAGC